MERQFIILHHGDGTLHVHAHGCKDTKSRRYDPLEVKQPWLAKGETVEQALQPELDELNANSDHAYKLDAWFTVFPCTK